MARKKNDEGLKPMELEDIATSVNDEVSDDDEEVVEEEKLSRTMKNVIEMVISKLPEEDAWNENKILFEITNYFVDKFPGDTLEYQLKRMKMETTGKIKKAIEIYMTRYANTK